jgi:lysophospholipase L1-like esterase
MPVLMTFGDSNTHGTPPIVDRARYERFGPGVRWPTVAQAALGPSWELAEEGLPGRTAQFDDPVMGAHMNGRIGLRIALQTHGPIDVMTLMLGTNDAKARFTASAEQIASGLAGLLDVATHDEYQTRHGGFKILLICPPPVLEQGPIKNEFFGARARSLALPPLCRALADNYGCGFLDAGEVIEVSPIDGVHYDEAAHLALGQAVAKSVSALVG